MFRGHACRSLIWSAFASVALAGLLIVLLLVALLMESGGRMSLDASRAAEFTEITGLNVAPGGVSDIGLGTVVWSMREHFWGESLATVYSEVPLFQSSLPALLTLTAVGLLLMFAFHWFMTKSRMCSLRAGLDVAGRLRRNLHRQVLRVGPGDLLESDQQRVASLFSADVDSVQTGVSNRVYTLGAGTAIGIVAVGIALLTDWRGSLQCLIPLLCCWYLFVRFENRDAESRRADEQARGNELKGLAEGFGKTRIIRGFGMETSEHQQFQTDLDSYQNHVSRDAHRGDRRRWAIWGLAAIAVSVVLVFLGVKSLQPPGTAGSLSPATALFLICVFGVLYFPLQWLTRLPREWTAAAPAADRIYRYLDRIPDVSQAVGAKFLQPLSSAIQFESVHYRVSGEPPLLKGLDLKLPARMSHAIVSLNPLEARALVYLIPRFIEPESGRVFIDGEDIEWVTLESLRAEVNYVGGTDPWFTRTVLENIRCGDERRSLQDVTEAAKTVHAHKFISSLPKGYETRLGHNGLRLNPGQSFRLALARALLRNPALLIIEEPQQPLDHDTKSLLDDAYNRILADRTVIFLPSRLSTVRRVESVVLVNNGRVQALGKHADLVKTNAAYRHWEYTRFNEFRNGPAGDEGMRG